ncbi:MAG: SUMF1/EgtB/PvdO family nonheme iron enzyme [Verrucomicrobiota bacterium]|jgi:formylglycine-generating enzyme required for sulfatase activity
MADDVGRDDWGDPGNSVARDRSLGGMDSIPGSDPNNDQDPGIDDWRTHRGSAPRRIQIGDTLLGRYVVRAILGRGGMGIVYRCLDTTADVEVAMKGLPTVISNNYVEMEDIRSNFRLVHNLYHPRIAAVTHLEQDRETEDHYLVMELAQGRNLQQYRKDFPDDQMPLKVALPILRQVAEALDYAHSRGVIHRDIKPSNIMVGPDGDTKVLDFGLAAQVHSSMSRLSTEKYSTSGTAPYMAPEQWRGRRQAARTDQYALAVTAYELLSGYLPFENPDHDIMRSAVLNEEPEPIEGLPGPIWRVLKRALSKDAKARFEACSEFVHALDEAINAPPTKATGTPRQPSSWPKPIIPSVPVFEAAVGPTPESGWKVTDLGMEFVYVAPGSFRMGSTESEAWSNEKPVHTVELTRGYWLGKYEVTNGDWNRFLRESSYDGAADADSDYMRHHRDWSQYASTGDSYPIVCVSWKNAVAYCEWLTQRERGAGRLPQGYAYRLPTEAEWEYAARGGKNGCSTKYSAWISWCLSSIFRGGKDGRSTKYSGSDNLGEVGWYDGNSGGKTHEVGGKRANELGLYDMSGNVWEWCWDRYGEYSSSLQRDPVGPGSGSRRVVRGGGWGSSAGYCRVTFRRDSPVYGYYLLGFRVALAPQFN